MAKRLSSAQDQQRNIEGKTSYFERPGLLPLTPGVGRILWIDWFCFCILYSARAGCCVLRKRWFAVLAKVATKSAVTVRASWLLCGSRHHDTGRRVW